MYFFITGGAGFIGSHLTERLLASGNSVICIDNLDNYYLPSLKMENIEPFLRNSHYTFIEGDVRNGSLLKNIFSKYACNGVIHLAARAGVRQSVQNPSLYVDVNVNGTLTLLEAMRQANIKKMVIASSSSVYGNSAKIPFSEADPCDRPLSSYAASKRAAELLAHTYHHLYGFDITCLRFFTVYGPRQRPEMAITQFVDLISNGLPVNLYGDGSTARDYTYVEDIVKGIVAAIQNLGGFHTFNIGSSAPIALLTLIQHIEKVLGRNAHINWQPMQPGDVEITYADLTLAQRTLQYNPTVTISEGIQRYVAWYLGKQGFKRNANNPA